MATITLKIKDAIRPYLRDKAERIIAEYRVNAQKAVDAVFEDVVEDVTDQLVKAGLARVRVKNGNRTS